MSLIKELEVTNNMSYKVTFEEYNERSYILFDYIITKLRGINMSGINNITIQDYIKNRIIPGALNEFVNHPIQTSIKKYMGPFSANSDAEKLDNIIASAIKHMLIQNDIKFEYIVIAMIIASDIDRIGNFLASGHHDRNEMMDRFQNIANYIIANDIRIDDCDMQSFANTNAQKTPFKFKHYKYKTPISKYMKKDE